MVQQKPILRSSNITNLSTSSSSSSSLRNPPPRRRAGKIIFKSKASTPFQKKILCLFACFVVVIFLPFATNTSSLSSYDATSSEEEIYSLASFVDSKDTKDGTSVSISKNYNVDRSRSGDSSTINNNFSKITQYNKSQEEDNTIPQIVWLISYPNSGTSFTLNLVHSASNKTVATNYQKETKHGKQNNISMSKNGPYVLQDQFGVPNYILTKTHCSGYCNDCPIEVYSSVNRYQFMESCATVKNLNIPSSIYDYTIEPKRVIRLVRDPFDNAVSNFHHWRKKQIQLGTGLEKDYMKDRKGFMGYCRGYDVLFKSKLKKERKGNEDLGKIFEDMKPYLNGVPCHQQFFRYTNWHNNANYVTKDKKTLVVHYDEYESSFNTTARQIFDFLEIDVIAEENMTLFQTGKTYRDYYTDDQLSAISKFIKYLAQPLTLDLISSYLV